jgi:hypothetical protein
MMKMFNLLTNPSRFVQRLFDKSMARYRQFPKLAFQAQTVEIAYLPLRRDLLPKIL